MPAILYATKDLGRGIRAAHCTAPPTRSANAPRPRLWGRVYAPRPNDNSRRINHEILAIDKAWSCCEQFAENLQSAICSDRSSKTYSGNKVFRVLRLLNKSSART